MAFGATLTLPTITGSHSDFPVLLKTADFPAAAVDGGANSILNGGGDLRAYTSSAKTTQLPLEIVTFVAGGTPDAEVYVKIPTAATSNTIFIEADATETVQPAVTATYGRNAVWADYETVAHLKETANNTAGGYTDSSGNNDGTGISMALSNVSAPFGANVAQFDGLNDRIEFPLSLGATDDVFTIQAYSNPDDLTVDQRLFSLLGANSGASSEVLWMDADGAGDGWRAQAKNSFSTIYTVGLDSDNNASASWQLLHHSYGSSNIIYVDGSSAASGSGSSGFSDGTGDADTAIIANIWQLTGTGAHFDGGIAEFRLRMSVLSADWIATEHANMDAATNWVTVGTWADSAGAVLIVQSLNQAQLLGDVSLVQHNVLGVNDLNQAEQLNSVALTQHNALIVDELLQAEQLENATLTSLQIIAQDLTQLQQLSGVSLTQHHILVADSLDQNQQLGNVSLSGSATLFVQDLTQSEQLSESSLSVAFNLIVDNLSQSQQLDESALTAHHVLVVNNMTQAQILSIVSFGATVIECLEGQITITTLFGGEVNIQTVLDGTVTIQ